MIFRFFLLALCFFFTGSASAGWNSGGGRIHHDSNNPWFLENTTTVRYCIEHDPKFFHADRKTIEDAVSNAFDIWKQAIGDIQSGWKGSSDEIISRGVIRLGTQTFVKQERCDQNSDIQFLFGVLDGLRRRVFGDNPRNYIAATVRTNYDRVHMRARGFVYLAADSGTLRPEGGAIHDRVWQACDGCILRAVLSHEVGHIFGASHERASAESLMDAKTLERIANQKAVDSLDSDWNLRNAIEDFSARIAHLRVPIPNWSFQKCDGQLKFWIGTRFFGIPEHDTCVHISFTPHKKGDGHFMEMQVHSFGASKEWIKRGQAVDRLIRQHSPISEVWLPKEQKIFPDVYSKSGLRSYYPGLNMEILRFSGQYLSHTGMPLQPFEVKIDPLHGLQLAAMVDGTMHANIFETMKMDIH